MSTRITITLPDELYQHATDLARRTRRQVDELLADAVAQASPAEDLGAGPLTLGTLADEELLVLTDLQLPADQDQRFSELLDRQQAGCLAPGERAELLSHRRMYQQGLLLKAQALAEAVRRGLIPPLES